MFNRFAIAVAVILLTLGMLGCSEEKVFESAVEKPVAEQLDMLTVIEPETETESETETETETESESETESVPTQISNESITYVLNTNTKKFHIPNCSSVVDIKAANRKDSHGTREEIISLGYVPCKRCEP